MALTTFGELNKSKLDIGTKWIGDFIHLDNPNKQVTCFSEIDFDKATYYTQHILFLGEIFDLQDNPTNVICIYSNIPRSEILADSPEELIEYCKTAPLLCPKDGKPKIGYKLVKISENDFGLCKLQIPPDARRTNPYFGRKCRADRVKVLSIRAITEDGYLGKSVQSGYSALYTDNRVMYHVGEYLEATYNPSRLVECTQGIHFYMTIDEVLELYKAVLRNKI